MDTTTSGREPARDPGRDPAGDAGRTDGRDPIWLYGLVPWWLGFTIAVSLIAGHDVPARGGLALAGEIALGCGLVISAAAMVTALARRSRRA